MLSFPTIPTVTDGQVLGAAQLNGYGAGCNYLLGESHAAMPLPGKAPSSNRYESGWGTVWEGYLYHGSNRLYYLYHAKTNNPIKPWHTRLLYVGDDAADHVLFEHSGYSDTFRSGALNNMLTSATLGRAYLYKFQTHTDDETYNSYLDVWALAERGVISGWVAPPTFAAGASSAAELNTLGSDLKLLHDNMIPPATVLCRPTAAGWENDDDHWHDSAHMIWRYRPHLLYAQVRLRASAHVYMEWRVRLTDQAGNSAVIYTSPEYEVYGYYTRSTTIDMTDPAVQSALSAAGITLTAGTHYQLTVGQQKTEPNPDAYFMDRIFLCRLSDQTPAAGWTVPLQHAHGDQTATPANLNDLSDDVLMLYSGDEELWGESVASWSLAGGQLDWFGKHRKRWLIYTHASGARPQIHYGSGLASSTDLPTGTGWQSYDLEQIAEMVWGGTFYVSGIVAAFECDGAVP